MTQKKFLLTNILLVILLIATFSTFSVATSTNTIDDSTTTIGANSAINPELISPNSGTDSNPTTTEEKHDDLLLTGVNVKIEHAVYGNVYVSGSNSLTISAPVYGNIYGLSQKIIFNNSSDENEPVYVSGSVYLYGTDINLSLHCQDLYAYSNNDLALDNLSNIERDVRISAQKLSIFGTIGRNAYVNVSDISMENGDQKGFIQGNLSYTNHKEISVPEDLVGGEITFNLKALDNTPTWLKNLYSFFFRFICTLLLLFILTRTSPQIVHPEKQFVIKKFLGVCLYGIVIMIVIPLLCAILGYISLKLLMFILPVLLIYAAFMVLGIFTTMIYIAGHIQKKLHTNSIWIAISVLFGLNLIFYFIAFIPNFIIIIVILLLFMIPGFGLLASQLLEKRNKDKININTNNSTVNNINNNNNKNKNKNKKKKSK